MKLLIIALAFMLHTTFLSATESSFKITFGSKIGNVPLEISKTNLNAKTLGGIKLNSWTLSPNFSSIVNNKKSSYFLENKDKDLEESVYIQLNFKF